MGYKNIIITKHIQERMRERFPLIWNDIENNPVLEIKNLIDEGYVSKSFLNNTKFMEYLYKTYGYEHTYDFVVHGDIVFVIKKKKGDTIAVTCLDKKKTSFIQRSKKFKGKKKTKRPKKVIGIYSLNELDVADCDIDQLIDDMVNGI